MKLKTIQDISNVESWEDLRRYSSQIFSDMTDLINGKLSLTQDNCDTQEVTATFQPGVELRIPHTLNRIPARYIVTSNSTGVIPFTGVTPWTTDSIYLNATGAGVLKLLLE